MSGIAQAVRRPEPPLVAAALVVLFVAASVWWVGADSRGLDFDTGKHLNIAFGFSDAFGAGEPFAWITDFTRYPPLVHLVGTLGTIGGTSVSGPMIASNVVFVPLLAAGCYGAASIAYDRTAGVLAVLFALGTPMVITQFHSFLLDGPAAAMAAVAAWALLASERFERVGISALAGVAVGLGTMAKQTFLPFVAGLLLVMFIRGGWRAPRGMAAFVAGAVLTAGPWVALHLPDLMDQSRFASGPREAVLGSLAFVSLAQQNLVESLGLDDLAFYGWNFLNFQFLVPLTLFFVVGTVWSLQRFVRTRADTDLTPELAIGGLVALVGTAVAIGFNDPRYTLGCIVYVAVLGTGWITQAGRRLRLGAMAALVVVVALNTASGTFGLGDSVRYEFAGAPPGGPQRQLTFYSTDGHHLGDPQRGPALAEIFEAARADGVSTVAVDSASANRPTFNADGVYAVALAAGLGRGNYDIRALEPDTVLVVLRPPAPGEPPPCATLPDGTRVDLVRGGDAFAAIGAMDFYCPPGAPSDRR